MDTDVATPPALDLLYDRLNYWFHEPSPLMVRATLATVAALILERYPVWLLIVGPASTGKTEINFPIARGYPAHVETSDVNIPGLLPMGKDRNGKGLLNELGKKGLWLIKDFSSILGMREEKRNEVSAAWREIYDGRYQRHVGTGAATWTGLVNVIGAATPAVEHYHRVTSDLGDRFIQVRTRRQRTCSELAFKANRQQGQRKRMHQELTEAAANVLGGLTLPTISTTWAETVWSAATLAGAARTSVYRSKLSFDLLDVSPTEGSSRLYQSLCGALIGDAAIHRQTQVGEQQRELLIQLVYDTMPLHRGNALRGLRPELSVRQSDAEELSGEPWPTSFHRAIEDLSAIGIITLTKDKPNAVFLKLSEEYSKLVEHILAESTT